MIAAICFISRQYLQENAPLDPDERHFDDANRSTNYIIQVLLAQGNIHNSFFFLKKKKKGLLNPERCHTLFTTVQIQKFKLV
jgi:hypothetical protein